MTLIPKKQMLGYCSEGNERRSCLRERYERTKKRRDRMREGEQMYLYTPACLHRCLGGWANKRRRVCMPALHGGSLMGGAAWPPHSAVQSS